jgi:hypothetical protein
MFQKLNLLLKNNMKTFATFFAAILISISSFAAAPGSNPSLPVYDSHGLAMQFLGNSRVKAGNTIAVELNSSLATMAELTVENNAGKQLVDLPMEIVRGANVLKFNVSDIPAGVYFIKVKTELKTETLTFVVQ